MISDEFKGKRLGLKLINLLTELGFALGCYKVILDCDDKNTGFYEKCGYERKGTQMAKYCKM